MAPSDEAAMGEGRPTDDHRAIAEILDGIV
jgi:hypothetical protein